MDKVHIPEGDVLIHCGDALSRGTKWEFVEFSCQMHQLAQRFKLVLYTPGNHELCVEADIPWARDMFTAGNCRMLIHEPYAFEGVKFFGSPYQPDFFNWAFQYPPGQAELIWRGIPDNTDVVFTHGMPYGILDTTGRLVGQETDFHAGCPVLRDRLLQVKPKVFAGGHLHLCANHQLTIGGTLYINAATCDDGYRPLNPPVVIEYVDGKVVSCSARTDAV